MSFSTYDAIADMQVTIKEAVENRDADVLHTIANALFEHDEEQAHFVRSQAFKVEQMKWKEEKHYDCDTCKDERAIEVLGDAGEHGWDVVDYKPCPDCKWEDPIQD